jgi:hypothetical protein
VLGNVGPRSICAYQRYHNPEVDNILNNVHVGLQGMGGMAPLTPSVFTQDARVFQATLELQVPTVRPTTSRGPTDPEATAARDLQALLDATLYTSYATQPATEDARVAILQEFLDHLQERHRALHEAVPADVISYLISYLQWAHSKGNYQLDGAPRAAPTSVQQRWSHLKTMLEKYPCFRGPWHDSGVGAIPFPFVFKRRRVGQLKTPSLTLTCNGTAAHMLNRRGL